MQCLSFLSCLSLSSPDLLLAPGGAATSLSQTPFNVRSANIGDVFSNFSSPLFLSFPPLLFSSPHFGSCYMERRPATQLRYAVRIADGAAPSAGCNASRLSIHLASSTGLVHIRRHRKPHLIMRDRILNLFSPLYFLLR